MKLPYVPKDDWKDMPKAGISSSNSVKFGINQFPENQKKMWSAYLATVTFMDEQVGRILKALQELELDRETAVFFTSDHGYLLGEHDFWQKSNLREEVTRVPLIIKSPGHQSGRSRSIVELVDLFPTACELTGLKIPVSVQGKSLTPILRNPKREIKKSALSFVRGGTSMRTEKWSYMKYKDGGEELYDMKKDPGQYKNLTGIQSFSNDLKSTRKLFSQEIKSIRH